MKLIDLNFFVNSEFDSLNEAATAHKEALGYVDFIKDRLDIEVIKHISRDEQVIIDGVKFSSFRAGNGFFNIPLRTLRYVKRQKPDVVIVQGLIFPVQVIWLHFFVPRSCHIIVQHHKEGPYKLKRIFQKIADRYTSAYMFTAFGNAQPWIDKRVIRDPGKCFEVPEASTSFSRLDKETCKIKLELNGSFNFLFVGRLIDVKDPLTILNGFEKYLSERKDAKLYMIYQTEELLNAVKDKINGSKVLENAVYLIGKVAHSELEYWYNAADFFVSASHEESAGYAMFEAMACGCIPVVSDIPPFRVLTAEGKCGQLFERGSSQSLFEQLVRLDDLNKPQESDAVTAHFQKELSFRAIADKLITLVQKLKSK